MANLIIGRTRRVAPWKPPWARVLLASAMLFSASACWFGGGSKEEKIDPNEATARDATFRTDAEKARDDRFKDRLQKWPRLDEPVR